MLGHDAMRNRPSLKRRPSLGRWAVARVVLVEAINLPTNDQKTPNICCSIQLGRQNQKSKVANSYVHPVWNQDFEFDLHDGFDDELQVTIKNKSGNDIGEVFIDFTNLKSNNKIDIWKDVKGTRAGKLRLFITISGITVNDSELNENNITNWETWKSILTKQKSVSRHYFATANVGHVLVYIHRAKGIPFRTFGGEPNPFCYIAVGEVAFRTQTVISTRNPSWDRYFEFDVQDITDCLQINILDENNNNKNHRCLGSVKVPFLCVHNNEKVWHTLINDAVKSGPRVQEAGEILLEFFIDYNKGIFYNSLNFTFIHLCLLYI